MSEAESWNDLFPKGRYDEVSVLSTVGGMGVILRCKKGEKLTAVKLIRDPAPDVTFLERFKREIRINQTLNHPNVIKTHAVQDAKPPYWYEMELAGFGPLKQHIPRIKENVKDIKGVFLQICEGVLYLHEHPRKIVHRDLKPQNILVFDGGVVKVTDVGLARYIDRDTTALTDTGLGWGTLYYRSPEQAADFKNAGLPTDIYALGVILYELFTDSPVMTGHDIESIIPPPYDSLIKRMTRANPGERYPSVRELLTDLKTRTRVYEKVSLYENPTQEADEIVARANGGARLDGEGAGRLLHILSDNRDVEDLPWNVIDKLSAEVLDRLAVEDPDALHRLVEMYAYSIEQTMRGHFPFGWMDGWSDFMKASYLRAVGAKTKRIALEELFRMAYQGNQFYTQRLIGEMVPAFGDADLGVIIELLVDVESRAKIAKAWAGVAMSPRLRHFLYETE